MEKMGKTVVEKRTTTFDVKPPFRMSNNRYTLYCEELENTHLDERLNYINDETACGEFYTRDGKATYVRITVDNRFLSNAEALEILENVFKIVKTKTSRFREYAH